MIIKLNDIMKIKYLYIKYKYWIYVYVCVCTHIIICGLYMHMIYNIYILKYIKTNIFYAY